MGFLSLLRAPYGARSTKLIVELKDGVGRKWSGRGEQMGDKVLKGNISKNSRQLRESSKVTKRKNSRGYGKGEVLDEPV